MRYLVVGPCAVGGVEPGGVVEFHVGDGVNVVALIDAGHVRALPAERKPAAKRSARKRTSDPSPDMTDGSA